VESVARILGSAFADDPIFRWFCGDHPDFYWRLFRYETARLYRFHDLVFINESGNGAALWLPPGVAPNVPFHVSQFGMLFGMLRRGGLTSLRRGGELGRIMAEHHLHEPHFYLHAIGAMQGCQGRGIGSALLKHGVRLCDEAGYPAYLESSNIRNNPLYERFGFEITAEVMLPEDGPTMWLMRRPAAS
jgi:ribosomal protein S18 acetylase RimI-like enzyme